MNSDNLCPICYEVPFQPVTFNLNGKKCEFSKKNMSCLTCVRSHLERDIFNNSNRIRCPTNCCEGFKSNKNHLHYGDINRTPGEPAEKNMWDSMNDNGTFNLTCSRCKITCDSYEHALEHNRNHCPFRKSFCRKCHKFIIFNMMDIHSINC